MLDPSSTAMIDFGRWLLWNLWKFIHIIICNSSSKICWAFFFSSFWVPLVECRWSKLLSREGCWAIICCNNKDQYITFFCLGTFTKDCSCHQRLPRGSQWRLFKKKLCACVRVAWRSHCELPLLLFLVLYFFQLLLWGFTASSFSLILTLFGQSP